MCDVYLDLEGLAVIVTDPVKLRVDSIRGLIVIVFQDYIPVIFSCKHGTNLFEKR